MSQPQQRVGGLVAWKNLFGLKPNVVVDVGCAGGKWASDCKQLFPEAKLFLVEGDSRFKGELDNVVSTSSPPGDIKYAFAVVHSSDGAEVTWHQTKTEGFVGGHLLPEITPFGQNKDNFDEIKVSTRTLTSLLAENGFSEESVSIINLDVQGSELDVLRGCSEMLEKYKPIIVTSVNIVEYNLGCAKFTDVIKFFDGLGYEMRDMGRVTSLQTTHGSVSVSFQGIFCEKGKYDICQEIIKNLSSHQTETQPQQSQKQNKQSKGRVQVATATQAHAVATQPQFKPQPKPIDNIISSLRY